MPVISATPKMSDVSEPLKHISHNNLIIIINMLTPKMSDVSEPYTPSGQHYIGP